MKKLHAEKNVIKLRPEAELSAVDFSADEYLIQAAKK